MEQLPGSVLHAARYSNARSSSLTRDGTELSFGGLSPLYTIATEQFFGART